MWTFNRTVSQHRSRGQKSEMEFNVELTNAFLRWQSLPAVAFKGLPPLKLPAEWSTPKQSPDVIVVVANSGSARNWNVGAYVEIAEARRAQGLSVDFLVSGLNASEKIAALNEARVAERGFGIQGAFAKLRELVVYLARAREVIASSTGPLHVAHAAGVPGAGNLSARTNAKFFAVAPPRLLAHGARRIHRNLNPIGLSARP